MEGTDGSVESESQTQIKLTYVGDHGPFKSPLQFIDKHQLHSLNGEENRYNFYNPVCAFFFFFFFLKPVYTSHLIRYGAIHSRRWRVVHTILSASNRSATTFHVLAGC